MFKVFVGGISPEGEHLLTTYLNVFMPDAVIEPLKAVGIKGKMKNHAKRQDVALVIIDESLYQACVGVADDVLSLPKVHKYTDDESLNQFLISKFGRLDGVDVNESSVIPPDILMNSSEDTQDDSYIPKNAEIFTSPSAETTPPDKIINGSEGIVHTVSEDTYDNLAITDDDITAKEKDSDIIEELRDKLAKSEMLVHNLTLQLEDKSANSDDDIAAFVGRIHELELQIEEKDRQIASSGEDNYVQLGKVARAEQIINDFDELKEKLRLANEDKSQLEFNNGNLSSQVELLHVKVDELKNQVAEIEVLRESLGGRDTELEQKKAEIEELKSKLENLSTSSSDEISKLKDEVNKKEQEIESIRSELTSALDTVSELRAELEQKIDELSERTKLSENSDLTINELNIQINNLSSEVSDLKESLKLKDSELEEFKQNEVEFTSKLELVNSENEELGKQLENYKSVQEKLTKYKDEVEELNNTISELQSSIKDKDDEIQRLSDENSVISSDNEVQSKAVDKVLMEKNELEDKLVDAETKCIELEGKITDLERQIDKANNSIVNKDTDILELKAKCDSLETQVESLKSEAIDTKADAENISRLEKELLDERKNSAKLLSEVEVLRKTDDSSKTSELRIEIARLKSELTSVKDSSANAEELEICKNELKELRERCSILEMDIVEKDEIIKELESGVFGRMAGVAFSKAAFDINLPSLTNIPNNFYCVAGGSTESNLVLYQLLKKSCVQDASKRILILDLATDSYIDREFGIQKAVSPVAWLEGSESFKNFIAQTRYNNVRVLTTALSYLNDLSLLNVDWQSRMNDLSSFSADIIIINVGCLNSVVSKVLFNMFSSVMTSYVITKATPINLRSVILNMTGFREVSHFVTVSCVGFDEKASRNMYQRLVAKYKAQILGDSDVLKL